MPRVDEQVFGRLRTPQSSRAIRIGSRTGRRNGAFTLIEAAIATVIIGVAFTAMLQLIANGTEANNDGTELTTAINLAGNIHEAGIRLTYDSIFDIRGTFSPPVNAKRQSISSMSGWSQVVSVNYVDENNLLQSVPDTQYEPTARITCVVQRNGHEVYRTSWLAAASQ